MNPFEEEDIEDVRIIIKANGKHYSIIPKEGADRSRCQDVRRMCLAICLVSHVVASKPLEDLKK